MNIKTKSNHLTFIIVFFCCFLLVTQNALPLSLGKKITEAAKEEQDKKSAESKKDEATTADKESTEAKEKEIEKEKEPFTKEELQTSLEIHKASREKALLSNPGRMQRIHAELSLGGDLKSFLEIEKHEDELTPEAFDAFISKVTAQNRCIKHIKIPKS